MFFINLCFFRYFVFDFTANAPCFSTDFARVFVDTGDHEMASFYICSFLTFNEIEEREGSYYGPENMKNLRTFEKSRKLNRFFFNVFRTPSTAATEPEPSHRLLWVCAWPTLLPHVVKPARKRPIPTASEKRQSLTASRCRESRSVA